VLPDTLTWFASIAPPCPDPLDPALSPENVLPDTLVGSERL
jgi:hypothetical protein